MRLKKGRGLTGRTVKDLREALGLFQDQFAKLIGRSRRTVQQLERTDQLKRYDELAIKGLINEVDSDETDKKSKD